MFRYEFSVFSFFRPVIFRTASVLCKLRLVFPPPMVAMAAVFAGVAFFSGLAGLHAAEPQAENRPEWKETVTRIGENPEQSVIVSESVRPYPAQAKLAYVYETEKGFKVCLNKACGPYVDRVAKDMPVISPDGNHWAAVVQSGGKARVMLNGNLGRSFEMVYGLRFSPDSMKLAYVVKEGEEFSAYVNQDRHQPFAFIDLRHGLFFSPDSKHLVYAASKNGKTWHLVKNGEAGPAYGEIKHVTFSPDSGRLAYAAKKDGLWHVVEGDEKSPAYLDIKRVRFSPDSEELVYVAYGDDGAFVARNGEKSAIFDHVPGEPIYSPNGEHLAFAVAEKQRGQIRMRIVIDGETGPAFEKIGAYLFSSDSKQFAYMAVEDEKGILVHDGERSDAYDALGMPVFAPEGRHLAYTVFQKEDWEWLVVKDGEKGPAFDEVENPVFGPNGERMVYVARQGNDYMVIEDGEIVGDTYEFAALPTFSPDGKHLAYTAAQDGEAFLVVDGQKGEERFLSFLKGSPLVFTDDNTVQGIAARAFVDGRQEFWLIRAEIEK